jgi:hypothetical protein
LVYISKEFKKSELSFEVDVEVGWRLLTVIQSKSLEVHTKVIGFFPRNIGLKTG